LIGPITQSDAGVKGNNYVKEKKKNRKRKRDVVIYNSFEKDVIQGVK